LRSTGIVFAVWKERLRVGRLTQKLLWPQNQPTQRYSGKIMAAARTHDDHLAFHLSLEHVIHLNQSALVYLQSGDEMMAESVLTDALSSLALITRYVDGDVENRFPMEGFNFLPFGLNLSRLPAIYASAEGAPCSFLSILDNRTFSTHHGLGWAITILTAVTMYHTALTIHRGSYRRRHMNQHGLTRSRELYDLCSEKFGNIMELKQVKLILDASVGQLYGLFDCSAAA
jgi:hypothetical protein